jgi:agmatine deiminase
VTRIELDTDSQRHGALMLATPREAGFRMPAEWEPHECCWMAWPARQDLWQDLPAAQRGYAGVARAIRQFEPVRMVADPESYSAARDACGPDIEVVAWPIDEAWIRDNGPTFLTRSDGKRAGAAWRFNAWGGKNPQYASDARLGGRLLTSVGAPVYHSSLVVEGGGIHTDGEGTILTTESVVLNRNRNPGITKAEAERELCEALGARKVIWLPGDLEEVTGDITDGHIDGIACFVRPGVVLYESDPTATGVLGQIAKENLRALASATDAAGRRLEIIHMEDAHELVTHHRLFARSYINFYIANGGIVMPGFGIAEDERAKTILQDAFPQRKVVQVDVTGIAPGGGGIHCITQQQPAASR